MHNRQKISQLIDDTTENLLHVQTPSGDHAGGWGYFAEPDANAVPNPLNTGEVLSGLEETQNMSMELTERKDLAVERGVNYLLSHQLRHTGGWGHTACYRVRDGEGWSKGHSGNLVSTYFAVRALSGYRGRPASGKMNAIFGGAIDFIKRCRVDDSGFRYSPERGSVRPNACIYAALTCYTIAVAGNVGEKVRLRAIKHASRALMLFVANYTVGDMIKKDEHAVDSEDPEALLRVTCTLFSLLARFEPAIDKQIVFGSVYGNCRLVLEDLGDDEVLSSVLEVQPVNEKDRQFIHLLPIWASIAALDGGLGEKAAWLRPAIEFVVSENQQGVSRIAGPKAVTWGGGLFLLLLAALQRNADVYGSFA